MSEAGQEHWTYKLFVENAELYLPALEEAKGRAEAELSALVDIFSWCGVPDGGKVLDVACGIGRHSVPLAERGYRVAGIDLSPLYVQKAEEYAEAAGVEVRFAVGDALEVEALAGEGGPYDAVLSMFTSHGYHGREADLSLFRQMRTLASPGGVFVLLTINRDWLVRSFEPEGVETMGDIRVLQRRSLDLETSTMLSTWEFYEGHDQDLRLKLRLDMDHRVYSLHELKELLEEAGWRFVQGLGARRNIDGAPGQLTYDSRDMWVVARVTSGVGR